MCLWLSHYKMLSGETAGNERVGSVNGFSRSQPARSGRDAVLKKRGYSPRPRVWDASASAPTRQHRPSPRPEPPATRTSYLSSRPCSSDSLFAGSSFQTVLDPKDSADQLPYLTGLVASLPRRPPITSIPLPWATPMMPSSPKPASSGIHVTPPSRDDASLPRPPATTVTPAK